VFSSPLSPPKQTCSFLFFCYEEKDAFLYGKNKKEGKKQSQKRRQKKREGIDRTRKGNL
jgi:hypothetical protein